MKIASIQALPPFPVKAAFRRHIGLIADDGLDPHGSGLLVELQGPKKVAVVGDGQSRVLGGNLLDPLEEIGKLRRPVQERKLGVLVEVGKPKAAHGV